MPSRLRLQQCAIAISIISLFYNTAEGVVSIVFGAESSSHALVFYGLQSAVEVISDFLVTWRFFSVLKRGEEIESLSKTSPQIIRIERIATITIGALLVALTIAAITTSATSLAAHDHPTTTLPAILIAATSTGFTLLMYLVKRYLARALNSSALNGEALCGLCCLQLSVVLLIGSLIYRVWKSGWWVDAATAIVIGLMFGWEGVKMIRWARHKDFDGGMCAPCCSKDAAAPKCATPPADAEKPNALEQEPSLCSCSQCCGCCKKEEPIKEEQV
ncbi:hypothetical protein L210DRAFT_3640235 [Boletus edulis BED1]|uniref:Cation efflux protein transmembrane domain-containing protein n=1 Tax=Boletus edulis BED1 TaxID=1328754 RepID=A0AAD4C8C8_BOLED|nr:hypothetical protein L210DRAFT_3640235 [Boletus edulis BED1]